MDLLNIDRKKRYLICFIQMNKNGASYIFPDPIQILDYSLQIDAFQNSKENKQNKWPGTGLL